MYGHAGSMSSPSERQSLAPSRHESRSGSGSRGQAEYTDTDIEIGLVPPPRTARLKTRVIKPRTWKQKIKRAIGVLPQWLIVSAIVLGVLLGVFLFHTMFPNPPPDSILSGLQEPIHPTLTNPLPISSHPLPTTDTSGGYPLHPPNPSVLPSISAPIPPPATAPIQTVQPVQPIPPTQPVQSPSSQPSSSTSLIPISTPGLRDSTIQPAQPEPQPQPQPSESGHGPHLQHDTLSPSPPSTSTSASPSTSASTSSPPSEHSHSSRPTEYLNAHRLLSPPSSLTDLLSAYGPSFSPAVVILSSSRTVHAERLLNQLTQQPGAHLFSFYLSCDNPVASDALDASLQQRRAWAHVQAGMTESGAKSLSEMQSSHVTAHGLPRIYNQNNNNQSVINKSTNHGQGIPLYTGIRGALLIRVNHPMGATGWAAAPLKKIADHLKTAMSRVVNAGHSHVVVFEDDLTLGSDTLAYFLSVGRVLHADESVFCVSAWHDNGLKTVVEEGWRVPESITEAEGIVKRWKRGTAEEKEKALKMIHDNRVSDEDIKTIPAGTKGVDLLRTAVTPQVLQGLANLGVIKYPNLLGRTTYFPGLGWMVTGEFWKKIESEFPQRASTGWDHWLRISRVADGKSCIMPQVPRTAHLSKSGTNVKGPQAAFYTNYGLANYPLDLLPSISNKADSSTSSSSSSSSSVSSSTTSPTSSLVSLASTLHHSRITDSSDPRSITTLPLPVSLSEEYVLRVAHALGSLVYLYHDSYAHFVEYLVHSSIRARTVQQAIELSMRNTMTQGKNSKPSDNNSKNSNNNNNKPDDRNSIPWDSECGILTRNGSGTSVDTFTTDHSKKGDHQTRSRRGFPSILCKPNKPIIITYSGSTNEFSYIARTLGIWSESPRGDYLGTIITQLPNDSSRFLLIADRLRCPFLLDSERTRRYQRVYVVGAATGVSCDTACNSLEGNIEYISPPSPSSHSPPPSSPLPSLPLPPGISKVSENGINVFVNPLYLSPKSKSSIFIAPQTRQSSASTVSANAPTAPTSKPKTELVYVKQGTMKCAGSELAYLNRCTLLANIFPCQGGCGLETGSEIPTYVSHPGATTYGQCLVTHTPENKCNAKHYMTNRVCPCVLNDATPSYLPPPDHVHT